MKIMREILLGFLSVAAKPLVIYFSQNNPQKIAQWIKESATISPSGMVNEFNCLNGVFSFFLKRVEIVPEDIAQLREISRRGSIVFVMKNRGRLEYRFFNQLFLREKIPLIRYANTISTLLWWPLKTIIKFAAVRSAMTPANKPDAPDLASVLNKGESALVNLTISRDYLFGLIRTNPLSALVPLLDIQKKTEKPITIIPLQFLYTKTPENAEKSFFDLLFGERSNPRFLRKMLFALNPRHRPLVKFGEALNLKEFVSGNDNPQNTQEASRLLLTRIHEIMRIEQCRITGPALKPKEKIIDEIMAENGFNLFLTKYAEQTKTTPDAQRKKALAVLDEIAADVNYTVVEFLRVSLRWVWERIFDGWVLNEESLNKIRVAAGKNPVVLVPMHRSHIDYLLISYIFYARNITFPHICAGINLNFWPVGKLIRKAGGFFIRRQFGSDALYKETFYSYLKKLLADGYCIEFFIEGTRSRTGKLLAPKMGVLGMILRAWSEGACEDINFVPVAINYDHIPEQKAYQNELSGAGKSKENARELLKAGKILKRRFGKIYLQFGEPISLKKYFSDQGIANAESKKEIGEFASHLTYNINRLAIVTPISLLSLALLATTKIAVTQEEMLERISLLRDYLEFKGAVFSDVLHFNPHWAVAEALRVLKSRALIKEAHTFEGTFITVDEARRVDLDYYKNNILHFFVSLACILKILGQNTGNKTVNIDAIVKQYDMLKTLFRHEFTFSQRSPLSDHINKVLSYLSSHNIVDVDQKDQTVSIGQGFADNKLVMLATGLLDNFLESSLILLRYMKSLPFSGKDKKTIIRDILTKAQDIFLKGDLTHPEALSQPNLENALSVAVDLGLVAFDREKSLYSFQADDASLAQWHTTISSLLGIEKPIHTGAGNDNKPVPAVIESVKNFH